jgi:tetratricopeptide (TPR) repeat protein
MILRMLNLLLLLAMGVAQAAAPQPAAKAGPDADRLFQEAVDAQMRGDFTTAIRDYRGVLQVRPQAVEARVNLGAALAHVGKFGDAIDEYKKALPLLKDKTGVEFNIALAYHQEGDWQHAQEAFAPLVKAKPNDVRVAILLGDTDVHLGANAEAVAMLAPLEQANAENPDFEFVFGEALVADGKRRDGVERLEKSAQMSNAPDAYVLAGSTLLEINEFERARHDLDTALKLSPDVPADVYALDGEACDKDGDLAAAEPAFREALKRDPDNFKANLYLGAMLYKRRDMEAAKPYLEKAVRLNPKDTMANYEDAMLKSTAGDTAAAAEQLEGVVKADPNWLEPHVELATLYYKLHRPKDGAKEREIVDRITAEQQKQGPK